MDGNIRLVTALDAGAIWEIYEPIVTSTAISFEIDAPSVSEIANRITEITTAMPWLVYEDRGEIHGYAYASKHRDRLAYQWSVEVSAYVANKSRRQGVGKLLYTSLISLLWQQGYFNAYAGITLPNPASIALHESVGFRPIGVYRSVGFKLGAWHDVGWWAVELQQRRPPERIIPIGEVMNRQEG